MKIEKILGVLIICYGINIAYAASKHQYPFNKESWYAYQFKDYFRAFLALILGLLLIFSNTTIKEIFD